MLFWVLPPPEAWTRTNWTNWTNWTKLDTPCLATTAPGAEANCKTTGTQRDKTKMHLSGAKFNRVWHRKGAFWNRKGQQKHPEKIDKHSPLFLGLKNQRIAAGKQPTENLTRAFPPAGVLKWPHSDRQVTRKTPPKKLTSISPSFKG